MDITGEIKILKRNYEGKDLYSTSLTNKNIDGTYENYYISAQLPKGAILENNTKIKVVKGFMSFYRNKNGLPQPKAVIQAFEVVKPLDTTPRYEENIGHYDDNSSYYSTYFGDDLPF